MDQTQERGFSWQDEDFLDATAGPEIRVSAVVEEMPTLAITTIVGVTIVVLVAIVGVFVLGILIDFRQQRLLNTKMEELRRLKNQRRSNSHIVELNNDSMSIVNEMEQSAMSDPPALSLDTVP